MYKDIKMVGLFLKKHYPHCFIYNVLNTLQCSPVYLPYIILFIVLYTTLYTKVEVAGETGIFNKETPHFLPNGYVIKWYAICYTEWKKGELL